jgi:hypothetical protein
MTNNKAAAALGAVTGCRKCRHLKHHCSKLMVLSATLGLTPGAHRRSNAVEPLLEFER